MSEFMKSASALSWWLSVVAVGIVLNIVSSYLKSGVDLAGSALSRAWSARSSAARAKFEARIIELTASQAARSEAWRAEVRERILAALYLLAFGLAALGSVLVATGTTTMIYCSPSAIDNWRTLYRFGDILLWIGTLFALMGSKSVATSMFIGLQLHEAAKRDLAT